MSTTSPFVRMTLQELDENPDTWGTVLNVSALELLEDSIAGVASPDVTSANVALNETAGADNAPHYRMMIINVIGAPGAARNVTCPPISKLYLVVNSTTGGQTITFRTTAGTGVAVPAGNAYLLFCNGTNIVAANVANAVTAGLAADATNAQALGSLGPAAYGQLATTSVWTKGQVTQAITKTVNGVGPYTLDINVTDSNAFYHLTTQNFTLTAPTGATVGHRFSLVVQQGVGAPHAISFTANTFKFAGGIAPALSTVLNKVDYFGFEYTTTAAGNRWVGSIIKDVVDV